MLPSNQALSGALQQKGINRRRFLKFCSLMTATLALPPRYVAQVAAALERARKPVLVWLAVSGLRREFRVDAAVEPSHRCRSRTGPALLGVPRDHHGRRWEAGRGGAGACGERRERESIWRSWRAPFHRPTMASIAPSAGETALDIARRSLRQCRSQHRSRRLCLGWRFGALQIPTRQARWVSQEAVPGVKVINLAGCPHNPANTAAVLVHYLDFRRDARSGSSTTARCSPTGSIIHDQCERRAHYDAGRYVQEWGDEGHRKG